MYVIHRFRDGKRLREATRDEYSRYIKELSQTSKANQLSGEVSGKNYGISDLIYIQDTSEDTAKTMKSEITYFVEAGRSNSNETLKLAKERALKRGIKTVIIASIRGETASNAIKVFKDTDINLIFATCNACFGCERFSKQIWKDVENAGHKVIYTNEDVIPFPQFAVLAYRRICQGMKVCVEITMSAVDQGYISPNSRIIAVAGTGGKSFSRGWGVDTALIIDAIGSNDFFKHPKTIKDEKLYGKKIREIICMPR